LQTLSNQLAAVGWVSRKLWNPEMLPAELRPMAAALNPPAAGDGRRFMGATRARLGRMAKTRCESMGRRLVQIIGPARLNRWKWAAVLFGLRVFRQTFFRK